MSHDEVVAVMKARHQHYELISRAEWERARLQCYYAATGFGNKIKSPRELFKLPWDGEKKAVEKPKILTREEALKRLQEIKKNRYHA
jgi:hypothetical protein